MDAQFLEDTWDKLLSRDPSLVRLTYASMDEASQIIVISHLHKMSSEPGWHPEQVLSALAALQAINE
jgi:hypothetical protein